MGLRRDIMRIMTQLSAKITCLLRAVFIAIIGSATIVTGASAADIATIYNDSCGACHDSGA